ncbi:hypothetical protein D9M70_567270 [compost metagenome]
MPVAHLHSRRACRHARYRRAHQVRAFAQLEDIRGRHMAFDELAVDYPGMTGAHGVRHAEAGLDRAHVRLDMVVDLEAVLFEMADPVLAATAVGVAVDVDGQRFGCLHGAGEQQREEGECAHGMSPDEGNAAEDTPGRDRTQSTACFDM